MSTAPASLIRRHRVRAAAHVAAATLAFTFALLAPAHLHAADAPAAAPPAAVADTAQSGTGGSPVSPPPAPTPQPSTSAPAAAPADPFGFNPILGNFNAIAPSAPAASNAPAAPAPAPIRGWLFEALPADFTSRAYRDSVEKLFNAFEQRTGKTIAPAAKRKAVLKINTAAGAGLATPKPLVTAVIRALIQRGFPREGILVVDLTERRIRECGYPCDGAKYPPLTPETPLRILADVPALPLDSEKYYTPRWAVESPLPSREIVPRQGDYANTLEVQELARRSNLPVPLFEDADLWISLPVAMDSPSLGVSAALANETIWNVSNQRRFLENPVATPEAAIEIARTLEGSRPETLVLHLLSLEKWQYIGGPVFDSGYCVSEKRLWLSANPIILDALVLQRINKAREFRKFPPISPVPAFFSKASLPPPKETTPAILLGSPNPADITLIQVK